MVYLIILILMAISLYDKRDKTNAIFMISVISIIVFILNIIMTIYGYPTFIPLNFGYLSAKPLERVWTIYTYAFLHSNLAHIFNNLLCIFLFSSLLIKIDNKTIWKLFLQGSLVGLIFSSFFLIIYYRMGAPVKQHFYIVGASAGIFSLLGFSIFNYPDYNLKIGIFNTKVKYMVVYLTIITLFNLMVLNNILGNYAHLGGFFYAWYLHATKRDKHYLKLYK